MTKRAWFLAVILAVMVAAIAAERAYRTFRHERDKALDIPAEVVVSRFIGIYARERDTHNHTDWMGIRTQQAPTDMWSVQEILWEVRPDFIIETGTLNGGSSLYFASLMHCINPDGRIITVDIEDQAGEARMNPLFQKYVTTLSGSSLDDCILSEIYRRVKGKRTLVFLDSDHHKNHVLNEMNAYARFVSVGSYMIVNDTFYKDYPPRPNFGPGPLEAVFEFLRENPAFEIDSYRTRFLLTFYPDGYLRRKE